MSITDLIPWKRKDTSVSACRRTDSPVRIINTVSRIGWRYFAHETAFDDAGNVVLETSVGMVPEWLLTEAAKRTLSNGSPCEFVGQLEVRPVGPYVPEAECQQP